MAGRGAKKFPLLAKVLNPFVKGRGVKNVLASDANERVKESDHVYL